MRRQRGIVMLMFVVVVAAIGSVFFLSASSWQAQQLSNRVDAERADYLEQSARALRDWYVSNLAGVDATTEPPTEAAIVAGAGITPRFGLRIAASNRLVAGELGFHNMAIWIPQRQPDPSTIDTVTGVFTPDVRAAFRLVSGAELQADALAQTRRVLRQAAERLENYFVARTAINGGNVSINHFRPDPACGGAEGELPCLDTYVAATAVDWRSAGVDGMVGTDGWGNVIQVSNLADSATAAPPYSMALQTRTPWGSVVQVLAVQRL
jgi:hypothetical protein